MGGVPANMAVFRGKPDNGLEGWYWTDVPTSRRPKARMMGPFETKEQALKMRSKVQRSVNRRKRAALRDDGSV